MSYPRIWLKHFEGGISNLGTQAMALFNADEAYFREMMQTLTNDMIKEYNKRVEIRKIAKGIKLGIITSNTPEPLTDEDISKLPELEDCEKVLFLEVCESIMLGEAARHYANQMHRERPDHYSKKWDRFLEKDDKTNDRTIDQKIGS